MAGVTRILLLAFFIVTSHSYKVLHVLNTQESICSSLLTDEAVVTHFFLQTFFSDESLNPKWDYETLNSCEGITVTTKNVVNKISSNEINAILFSGSFSELGSIQAALQLIGSEIPIISYSELPQYFDGKLPKNVYNSVPKFVEKLQTVIELLKSLEWNYVAVFWDPKICDQKCLEYFKNLAVQSNICFAEVNQVSENAVQIHQNLQRVVNLARTKETPMKHFGVIFIGSAAKFVRHLTLAETGGDRIDNLRILRWILVSSEKFSSDQRIIGASSYQLGTITTRNEAPVSMSNVLVEFSKTIASIAANDVIARANHSLLVKWLEENPSCADIDSAVCRISVWKDDVPSVLSFSLKAALFAIESVDKSLRIEDITIDMNDMRRNLSFLENVQFEKLSLNLGFHNSSGSSTPIIGLFNFQEVSATGLVQIGGYNKIFNANRMSYKLGIQKTIKFFNTRLPPYSEIGSSLVRSICPGNCAKECLPRDENFFYEPGDLILGMVTPVRDYRKSAEGSVFQCNGRFKPFSGYEFVQAFIYAIEVVNYYSTGIATTAVKDSLSLLDPNLVKALQFMLPKNLKFGYIVFNDCYSPLYIANFVTDLHSGRLINQPTCTDSSGFCPCHVIGYIGALSSTISTALARALRVLNLPQISYGSTALTFKNVNEYPYFMRTCGTVYETCIAQMNLLKSLKVTYVAVVYLPDVFGEALLSVYQQDAARMGICVSVILKFDCTPICPSSIAYELEAKNALYVALLMDASTVTKVLEVMKATGKANRFIFVADESVGVHASVVENHKNEAVGMLSLKDFTDPEPAFQKYMRSLPMPTNDGQMQNWLAKFWEVKDECTLERNFDYTEKRKCANRMTFKLINELSPMVLSAVYSMVLGTSKVLAGECGGSGKPCREFLACRENGGFPGEPDLKKCEKRTNAIIAAIRDSFEGPDWKYQKISHELSRYLTEFKIIQYQETSTGLYEHVEIGRFEITSGDPEGNLTIKKSAQWHDMSKPSYKYNLGCSFLGEDNPNCPVAPPHTICYNWSAPITPPPTSNNTAAAPKTVEIESGVWKSVSLALIFILLVLLTIVAALLALYFCNKLAQFGCPKNQTPTESPGTITANNSHLNFASNSTMSEHTISSIQRRQLEMNERPLPNQPPMSLYQSQKYESMRGMSLRVSGVDGVYLNSVTVAQQLSMNANNNGTLDQTEVDNLATVAPPDQFNEGSGSDSHLSPAYVQMRQLATATPEDVGISPLVIANGGRLEDGSSNSPI